MGDRRSLQIRCIKSHIGLAEVFGVSSILPDMCSSEKQVASFLKEMGLRQVFQFPVFVYDEVKRPRAWSPDF